MAFQINPFTGLLDLTGATASGSGGYTTIQDEGVALTARTKLNFIGMDVSATDDPANTRTNVKTGFARSFLLMGG